MIRNAMMIHQNWRARRRTTIPKALAVVLTLLFGSAGRADEQALAEALKAATQELINFNFTQGRQRFAAVVRQAEAGSWTWQRAVYGQALCLQHATPPTMAQINEAQRLLEHLVGTTPQSPLAPAAMLTLGRIAELEDVPQDTVDLPAARRWYQQVIDNWLEQPIADEATLRLTGSYIQVFDDSAAVAQGVRLLEAWLAERPDNPLASIMWQYLGETAFLQLKDDARALACYLKAEELGLTELETAGTLYWRMAILAERTSQWPVAVRLYQKIITQAPRSGRAFEAQLALTRLQAAQPQLEIEIPSLQLFSQPPLTSDAAEVRQ